MARFSFNLGDRKQSNPGLRDAPLSGKRSIIGFLFGLPFFLMGSFFCWMAGIQPLVKVVDSGSWPEAACVITRSEVERHSSSDGDTYSIVIEFRYTFDDRSYSGGQYDFSTGSSSGSKGKRRIVDRHPVGLETICLVNPANPEEAVLTRSIPGIVYFALPFSSIFIFIGLGVMAASLGLIPEKWAGKLRTRHKPVSLQTAGTTTLKPKMGKKGKLFGMLFFALFWNGIVSVFLFQVIKGFTSGSPEWFLVVFLIPFVVVGLGLICGVVYYTLALGNPTFTLSLSEGKPRLGETVTLQWHASGFLERLGSLSVTMEGREAATYRRGTRSVTDHSQFHSSTLFQTDNPSGHSAGKVEFRVPDDSMHSFDGGNNKIEWSFKIDGSIRRWPDVAESFPFTVRPLKLK